MDKQKCGICEKGSDAPFLFCPKCRFWYCSKCQLEAAGQIFCKTHQDQKLQETQSLIGVYVLEKGAPRKELSRIFNDLILMTGPMKRRPPWFCNQEILLTVEEKVSGWGWIKQLFSFFMRREKKAEHPPPRLWTITALYKIRNIEGTGDALIFDFDLVEDLRGKRIFLDADEIAAALKWEPQPTDVFQPFPLSVWKWLVEEKKMALPDLSRFGNNINRYPEEDANLYFDSQRLEVEILLAKDPENPDLMNWLGYISFEAKDFSKAIECFTGEIKVKPINPDAYYYLGLCYKQIGNHHLARKAWEKVLELKPNSKLAKTAEKEMGSITENGN